jgi:hypothetical protein
MLHKIKHKNRGVLTDNLLPVMAQSGPVSHFLTPVQPIVSVSLITGSQATSHKPGISQKNVKSVKHCSDRQIEGRDPC